MTFWTKTFVQLLLISFTVISSIVGGLTWMENRNDKKLEVAVTTSDRKVEATKIELTAELNAIEKLSDAKITSLDSKFIAEVGGLKVQLNSMDAKLNLLIGLSRKMQSSVVKLPDSYYTNYETIPRRNKL